MPRAASQWALTKGSDRWKVVDSLRVTPAPKLGGWAGKRLRLLSVSRGQSVLTDLEHGSLAVKQRRTGIPSIQRMWFHAQGAAMGYTNPRGSPQAAELYFFDADARLRKQLFVPAAVADAAAGSNEWLVACRDGRAYAFSLEGTSLWSELIPCARRDNSINESCGLPVFHPRLHLACEAGILAFGAEQEAHGYHTSGVRLWSTKLPTDERSEVLEFSTDFPVREERLARLGMKEVANRHTVETGYVRIGFNGANWSTQVQVSDIVEGSRELDLLTGGVIQIRNGLPFLPGITVLRAFVDGVVVGMQNGLVHIFDRDGWPCRTFQVGGSSVSEILTSPEGLSAACCAGKLTLFDRNRVTGSVELPDHFGALAACGERVLVWRLNWLWLVEPSGRVQLVAESERPIRGVWGYSNGFYVLAGELALFQGGPARSDRRTGK